MAYTKVVIIGGGFGGLNAAQALVKADVDVLIIDKSNHHTFQPLLYQVATAALSPGNIAEPIREILRNQANATVIMDNIESIDLAKKQVLARNGQIFNYDYLVLAPGSHHSYFGHPEWEEFAPGLKSIADAVRIRERVLLAFERAERCDSFSQAADYLRFVIIGGGPTGVEMAGAIAEIAHKTMFKNFRKIKPEQSEIFLIEGDDHILGSYTTRLSDKARSDLEKMGVFVMTGQRVTAIDKDGVYVGGQFIATHNIIWAAGNQASPLLESLNVPLDRQGRVFVEPDMSLKGYPDVFIIGDAAHSPGVEGAPLPGIAPVAIQQGKYVAHIIASKLTSDKRPPFRYFDKGMMATIGRSKAIAQIGRFQMSGFTAWISWAIIHIFYLVSFENRILVMIQWFFWYLRGKRPQRIIVNPSHEFHDEQIIDSPFDQNAKAKKAPPQKQILLPPTTTPEK